MVNIGLFGAIGVEDMGDVIMLQSAINLLKDAKGTEKNNLKLTLFALNKNLAKEQMEKIGVESDVVDTLTVDDLPKDILKDVSFNKLIKENLAEKISKKEYLNKISKCDALFFMGGGYINRYWGDKLIPSFILPIVIGHKLKKPIYISGVNLGPFDKEQIKRFYGMFTDIHTIIIRDRDNSLKMLEKLGGTKGNIILGGDDILSRWYTNFDWGRYKDIYTEGAKYAVVQLHHWVEMYSNNYIEFYKNLSRYLSEMLDTKEVDKIYFLPFSYFKGVDYECGRRLGTFMGDREDYIVFEPTNDYIFMRELISSAKFVIASRYHPVVFGIGEHVPTLGIYVNDLYEQKISGAYEATNIDVNSNMIYINEFKYEKLANWYKKTKIKGYINSDKIKEIIKEHDINRKTSLKNFINNLV